MTIWEDRFAAERLLTVRPTADGASALVVFEDAGGAYGRILDGPRLALSLHYDSQLTPDGHWVVQLADDKGSEVGHLCAFAVAGDARVDLTPDADPYVVRGLDVGATLVAAAVVDDDGYALLAIPADPWGAPRVLARTPNELWLPHVSADGALVSADTTDHNPGVRRPAVTVFDAATGERLAVFDDGPVRAVRFVGDRLLLNTERTGFSRPALWDPRTGARTDFDLPDLRGDVIALDGAGGILVLHVEDGLHRLGLLDPGTGTIEIVRAGTGSYADPDVASSSAYYAASFLAADGQPRIFEQTWATPPRLVTRDGRELCASEPVPEGQRLESVMVTSRDGTPVQLWWARPPGELAGTVLEVHGGPNLVTTDHYSPDAQAWLEEGFAYASLNYRGSVTFGRAFREGFWGCAGDREIEDVDAALTWLRAAGLADPATTFITGASYGGHLSLLSAGRLPGAFAGALALVAMADWKAAFADDMNPAIHAAWMNFLTVGELPFEETVTKFSPLTYVNDVTASVWLFQGEHDTRTPPTQANNYADALRAAGGDVLIEFFDAGHEPVGLDGRLYTQRRMLELARAALAGRRWDQLSD